MHVFLSLVRYLVSLFRDVFFHSLFLYGRRSLCMYFVR